MAPDGLRHRRDRPPSRRPTLEKITIGLPRDTSPDHDATRRYPARSQGISTREPTESEDLAELADFATR